MRVSCVICSDLFDGVAAAVVARCGHVFHERCLINWLAQSSTCPECRRCVTKESLIKLYFNIGVGGEVSTSTLENKISTLTVDLIEKNVELARVSIEKEQLKIMATISDEELKTWRQEIVELKFGTAILEGALQNEREKAARVVGLQSENEILKRKINLYSNLNTVVQGTQKDVEDVLKGMIHEPHAATNLALSCSLLKKELENTKESKRKIEGKVIRLKNCRRYARNHISTLTEQVNELEDRVESLEDDNTKLIAQRQLAPEPVRPSINLVITNPSVAKTKNPLPRKAIRVSKASQTEGNYKKRKIDSLQWGISEASTSRPSKQLKELDDDIEIVYSSYEANNKNSVIFYEAIPIEEYMQSFQPCEISQNATITYPL